MPAQWGIYEVAADEARLVQLGTMIGYTARSVAHTALARADAKGRLMMTCEYVVRVIPEWAGDPLTVER
jgi:hypothetical protein